MTPVDSADPAHVGCNQVLRAQDYWLITLPDERIVATYPGVGLDADEPGAVLFAFMDTGRRRHRTWRVVTPRVLGDDVVFTATAPAVGDIRIRPFTFELAAELGMADGLDPENPEHDGFFRSILPPL